VYNLRYHIATLVSVFLALAVGLLLGTIVAEHGTLSSQGTKLVASLQSDFDQIRAESTAVKKTNTSLTSFATQITPQVVGSVLASRTVLVIASPDTADTVAKVKQCVKDAGGKTAIATFSGADLSLEDSAVAAAAAKALGVSTGSIDATAVTTALVREWSTPGDKRLLTKALVSAGGLKLTGLPSGTLVAGVVVTDALDGTPDATAFRLASAFTSSVCPGVGVETTTRSDGTAVAAKKAKLSGVDDIDTPMGEVSLVWVLAGRAKGLYGAGSTADGAFPSPLYQSE
jgi:hypothetical protein